MNDEYLWSKKGSDPDIERLEGLLSEFRFEPDRIPVFAARPFEAPSGSFGKRFGWIFGIATPAFALALFGFWFFTNSSVGDLQVRAPQSTTPVREYETTRATPVQIKLPEEKRKQNGDAFKSRPTRFRTVYRSRRTKADRIDAVTAKNLTSEEKYAYDRLMLALSIAGTKLKVVQDTIDRSGDPEKRSIRNDK